MPSDEALEFLDFMVEANATSSVAGATSDQIMTALDIRGVDRLDELLRELIVGGYIQKRLPSTITGRSTYHVDTRAFDRLLKALDPDGDSDRHRGPPANVLLAQSGEVLLAESGDFLLSQEPAVDLHSLPTVVSSEQWTGIESRLQANPEIIGEIREKLREVDGLVDRSNLTNVERQKAKAITEALEKLVESPDPEWKTIVDLLRSPTLASILGLAGLIQLILKLIFGIG